MTIPLAEKSWGQRPLDVGFNLVAAGFDAMEVTQSGLSRRRDD